MRKGIAIAGNLIVDYIKFIDSYPNKGMLANIASVSRSVGGCATNTLINLAKMDDTIPLQCLGMVGGDENGQYLIDSLNKYGIDTSSVLLSQNNPTSFTDVFMLRETGERTFFSAMGANGEFSFEHLDFSKITADIFHIGYALLLTQFDSEDKQYGTVMAKTLANAREYGLKTSMDVVSENSSRFTRVVVPSLKFCNYVIINEVEAAMIVEIPARDDSNKLIPENMKKICEALFAKGVEDYVVIHAPEGGWSLDKRNHFVFVPSLLLPPRYIKGTVGAGDAFCAAMLLSLYREFDMEYALKISSAAAACNLAEENSIDGMKSFREITKMAETMPRRQMLIH